MGPIRKKLFSILGVIAFTVGLCQADELLIDGGRKITGRITNIENNEVTLDTGTNELVIDTKIIKAISTDSSDADLLTKVAELQNKINTASEIEKAKMEAQKEKLTGKKVDLYIRTNCSLCDDMENFLNKNGIKHIRFDIEQDVRAKRRMNAKGCQGLPCVIINNSRVVSGYDPNSVIDILLE